MRRLIALVALSLCTLAAGVSPALAQAPEKAKLAIGVGGKTLFYYLPLTIAERQGYFKAEGLDVEILDFPGGARALQALLGGSVDIVSGAYEHTVSQQAKGQKIGVTAPGSSTNMFVNNLLAKQGLKPDDVAIVGVGATAGAVAIMKKGEIDAISNLDPVISLLESDGTIVAVVDTRTAKGMQDVYGGAYAAGCVYAPVDFAKKYPNSAQAVVNAMVRALRFIQSSTPEQIVAAVPADYYTDPALYKAALEKNLDTWRHDGSISIAAGQNVTRDLKTFDPTVEKANIDVAKTMNMTFQQKAAQKYK